MEAAIPGSDHRITPLTWDLFAHGDDHQGHKSMRFIRPCTLHMTMPPVPCACCSISTARSCMLSWVQSKQTFGTFLDDSRALLTPAFPHACGASALPVSDALHACPYWMKLMNYVISLVISLVHRRCLSAVSCPQHPCPCCIRCALCMHTLLRLMPFMDALTCV
jgi:hypothetical protein